MNRPSLRTKGDVWSALALRAEEVGEADIEVRKAVGLEEGRAVSAAKVSRR
jgi:hypothetical protein